MAKEMVEHPTLIAPEKLVREFKPTPSKALRGRTELVAYLDGSSSWPAAPQLVVHCKRSPHDVYVGRPTVYGNPFSHRDGTAAKFKVATREEAIAKYEEWLLAQPGLVALVKRELVGKVLGCWCHPQPCHADVLARIANE